MTWHGHRLRRTIPYDASNGAERFGTRRAGDLIREIASEMTETEPGVVRARLPGGTIKHCHRWVQQVSLSCNVRQVSRLSCSNFHNAVISREEGDDSIRDDALGAHFHTLVAPLPLLTSSNSY